MCPSLAVQYPTLCLWASLGGGLGGGERIFACRISCCGRIPGARVPDDCVTCVQGCFVLRILRFIRNLRLATDSASCNQGLLVLLVVLVRNSFGSVSDCNMFLRVWWCVPAFEVPVGVRDLSWEA